MAKHFAVVPNALGEAERHLFKQWVTAHLDELPANFPQDGTTRRFRNALHDLGWGILHGENTVYVIKPDTNGGIEYAKGLAMDLDMVARETEDAEEEAQEVTFGLEHDMQQALRKNINLIERGLEIIDNGKERHTKAGSIDITARDANGKVVIIELKAPVAKPDVIAQTLAYMQAVSEEDNAEVRGIIIASDFVDRVKLAARQIPNLQLIKYSFQFTFAQLD